MVEVVMDLAVITNRFLKCRNCYEVLRCLLFNLQMVNASKEIK